MIEFIRIKDELLQLYKTMAFDPERRPEIQQKMYGKAVDNENWLIYGSEKLMPQHEMMSKIMARWMNTSTSLL